MKVHATPTPDKMRRVFYAGKAAPRLVLRPAYAPYGADDEVLPEDRYHGAPARNAYTDEVHS